jgi:Ca2+-transporting ATPase
MGTDVGCQPDRSDVGRGSRAAGGRRPNPATALAGLRVLAVATPGTADAPALDALPPLRPVGLVGIGDPLRANAEDTAQAFERSGVRLLLITGDHPATTAAIGTRLGILAPG